MMKPTMLKYFNRKHAATLFVASAFRFAKAFAARQIAAVSLRKFAWFSCGVLFATGVYILSNSPIVSTAYAKENITRARLMPMPFRRLLQSSNLEHTFARVSGSCTCQFRFDSRAR
jgi:hypothetical protein